MQVDANGRLERFTGFIIGTDGRIVRLLRAGEARPKKVDYAIDMGGRIVLPGLIDAHGHVMGLGESAPRLDLPGTPPTRQPQPRAPGRAAPTRTLDSLSQEYDWAIRP